MTICHQPYRDAIAMDTDQAIRMVQGFGNWITRIMSGDNPTSGYNAFVPNLPLPDAWKEKIAKDKEAALKRKQAQDLKRKQLRDLKHKQTKK
jgi:hypothetical protein